MPPPVTVLFDLAQSALDAIVNNWPAEAEPLPDVQFVSNGEIAMDSCESLAVFIDRTFPHAGDVTVEQLGTGQTAALRGATIGASLMRCVPTPTVDQQGNIVAVPTPEEQTESADLILRDAQALFNALWAEYASAIGCKDFAFESWTPIGPTGGQGGGTLRVRLSLVM